LKDPLKGADRSKGNFAAPHLRQDKKKPKGGAKLGTRNPDWVPGQKKSNKKQTQKFKNHLEKKKKGDVRRAEINNPCTTTQNLQHAPGRRGWEKKKEDWSSKCVQKHCFLQKKSREGGQGKKKEKQKKKNRLSCESEKGLGRQKKKKAREG